MITLHIIFSPSMAGAAPSVVEVLIPHGTILLPNVDRQRRGDVTDDGLTKIAQEPAEKHRLATHEEILAAAGVNEA